MGVLSFRRVQGERLRCVGLPQGRGARGGPFSNDCWKESFSTLPGVLALVHQPVVASLRCEASAFAAVWPSGSESAAAVTPESDETGRVCVKHL